MKLRLSTELTALLLGIVFTGGCGAIPVFGGCLLICGIGDGDHTLDSFEVTSPSDGDAFAGPITFTFAYAASPEDTGVDVNVLLDGVVVASGDAALPLTWTPAHDSGDLDLQIDGFIPGIGTTGEIEHVQLTLGWSAPWQATMLQCVGSACDPIADGLTIDAPVRVWAKPDFDFARTDQVEYRVDGNVIGTRTESAYWIDLDGSIAPDGPHTLEATVRRDDGTEATTSTPIVTAGACTHFLGVSTSFDTHIAIDAAATFYWSHEFAVGRKRLNEPEEPLWVEGLESGVSAMTLVGSDLWVLTQSQTRIVDTTDATPTPTLLGVAGGTNVTAVDDGAGGVILGTADGLYRLDATGAGAMITTSTIGTGTMFVDFLRDADGSLLVGHDQQLTRIALDGTGVEASRSTVQYLGTLFNEIGRDADGAYYTAGGTSGLTRWSSDFSSSEMLSQAQLLELIFTRTPGCDRAIVVNNNGGIEILPGGPGGLP